MPPWPRQKGKSAAAQYQFVAQQMGAIASPKGTCDRVLVQWYQHLLFLKKISPLLEGWVFVIRMTCSHCYTQQALRNVLDHLDTVTPTAQGTLHLFSAMCTKTAYKSLSIGTCLKQIMTQISAVWARSQNCEKRLLALSCLSDRPSVQPSARLCAWNNSVDTGRIFKKVDIGVFFENVSRKFQFH